MTIARFRERIALLEQRSSEFLTTLVGLGGYCTAGRAKQLGIAGSAGSDRRNRFARRLCPERSIFLGKCALGEKGFSRKLPTCPQLLVRCYGESPRSANERTGDCRLGGWIRRHIVKNAARPPATRRY
jgi:hypothetical protein